MGRQRYQSKVAAWRGGVREPQYTYNWYFSLSAYVSAAIRHCGEGFSREQQLTSQSLDLSVMRKLEYFKHAIVISYETSNVVHLRIVCASAHVFLAFVSVFAVLGSGVSHCRSQWIFDGRVTFNSTTVLSDWHVEFTVTLLSVRTASLCVLALAQVSLPIQKTCCTFLVRFPIVLEWCFFHRQFIAKDLGIAFQWIGEARSFSMVLKVVAR